MFMLAGANRRWTRHVSVGHDNFLRRPNLTLPERPILNFMPEDEVDRVEAAYGGNYRRLAEIKRQYDPQNLFRLNQNVKPV